MSQSHDFAEHPADAASPELAHIRHLLSNNIRNPSLDETIRGVDLIRSMPPHLITELQESSHTGCGCGHEYRQFSEGAACVATLDYNVVVANWTLYEQRPDYEFMERKWLRVYFAEKRSDTLLSFCTESHYVRHVVHIRYDRCGFHYAAVSVGDANRISASMANRWGKIGHTYTFDLDQEFKTLSKR
jgi:hypothetical protein